MFHVTLKFCVRRCFKLFVGFFSIYFVLALLVFYLQPYDLAPRLLKYKLVDHRSTSDTKYVLFFTNYWHFKFWGLSNETVDKDSPDLKDCRFKNCVFTIKRRFLKNILEFDAIFFHQATSTWYYKNEIEPIKARSPHQLYVIVSQESPKTFPFDYENFPEFFNLTMTYRIDSDIPFAYGQTLDLDTGNKIAPAYDIKWRKPEENFTDEKYLEVINRKTRDAVWFVSQCNRSSRRDDLATKLKNFIDVDVYGNCELLGNHSNPYGRNLYNETFKFYLAFENSLCIDYLTEKSYKVMGDLIIPVVYSGVELSRFLPPKSYIDANSFKTVEDLGKYLKFLAANPEEYVKYFWWKKYYKVEVLKSFDVCDICRKLNEPNLHTKKNIYLNINEWFEKDACTEPKIKF